MNTTPTPTVPPIPPQQTETPVIEINPQASKPSSADGHADGKDSESAPVSPVVAATAPITISGAVKVALVDLKPHPLNGTIYGNALDEAFVRSVKRNGIFHPLLVTHNNEIISGHQRWAAGKVCGITEVAVVYFESDDPLDIETALIEANKQREKLNEHIGREFNLLVEIESKRAAGRMATKKEGQGVKAVTQADKGKARDVAAKQIGEISGVSAQRAGKVVEAIDKLAKKKHKKKADELREILNKNIEKAHKLAVEWGELPAPAAKKPREPAQPTSSQEPVVAPSAPAPAVAEEHTSPGTNQPTAVSTKADVIPAPSAAVSAGDHENEAHDEARQAADVVLTFFRERHSTKLTESQKREWKQIGDSLAKFLQRLGIKISAA